MLHRLCGPCCDKLRYGGGRRTTRSAMITRYLDKPILIFNKLGVCSGPFSVRVNFGPCTNPATCFNNARLLFKNAVFDRVNVFADFAGAFRVGASAYQTLKSGSIPTLVGMVTGGSTSFRASGTRHCCTGFAFCRQIVPDATHKKLAHGIWHSRAVIF